MKRKGDGVEGMGRNRGKRSKGWEGQGKEKADDDTAIF